MLLFAASDFFIVENCFSTMDVVWHLDVRGKNKYSFAYFLSLGGKWSSDGRQRGQHLGNSYCRARAYTEFSKPQVKKFIIRGPKAMERPRVVMAESLQEIKAGYVRGSNLPSLSSSSGRENLIP